MRKYLKVIDKIIDKYEEERNEKVNEKVEYVIVSECMRNDDICDVLELRFLKENKYTKKQQHKIYKENNQECYNEFLTKFYRWVEVKVKERVKGRMKKEND